MALEELRELYKELNLEETKKTLDIDLFEMKAMGMEGWQNGELQVVTKQYFILYDTAEKKGLFKGTESEDYKIKYFDTIRQMIKDWENKK